MSKSIEEISDSAAEMAEVIIRGLKPHPVVDIIISESDDTITRIAVEHDSELSNKKIEDSVFQETGLRVLAIKRKW